MKHDPARQHRHSIRLKGYDYTHPGAYFVTMVTQHRECLFGEVAGGEMQVNAFGKIVQAAWLELPRHYPHAQLDAFCVMPNHVHGIIVLSPDVRPNGDSRRGGSVPAHDTLLGEIASGEEILASITKTRPYSNDQRQTTRHALSEIVRAFKSYSARRINRPRRSPGVTVWQRNYYEHIIRNPGAWERIQCYIENNPANWEKDHENPLSAI